MAGRKRGFSEILPRGADGPVRVQLATAHDRSTAGRYWNLIRTIVEHGDDSRGAEARAELRGRTWAVREIGEVEPIRLETYGPRIDALADAGELSFEDLTLT